jgi:hypothetical protein
MRPAYTRLLHAHIDRIVDPLSTIALGAGLGWASGLRLYAVLFFLGALHYFGFATLPLHLEIVAHPMVMAASGLMFLIEFGADKIPGFDSVWDAVQTFVRIPGGALLAAGAVADQSTALALAAAILGGTLAAGAHFTKAGSRVLINTSPEPFSNWTASFTEDTLAAAAVWFSLKYPLLMLALLVVLVGLMMWLLPKLWRGVLRVLAAARQLLGART